MRPPLVAEAQHTGTPAVDDYAGGASSDHDLFFLSRSLAD